MTSSSPIIRAEALDDNSAIVQLNETAFGPGRFARAAYRLREGVSHEAGLSFVVELDNRLIGSVRLTEVVVADVRALLLGPLVVDPD